MTQEDIDWIYKLKDEVPVFLDRLKGKKKGFFHYSLTGDLYSEEDSWGLGNTVFVTDLPYRTQIKSG